jgi:hypothetical protein
VARDSIVCASPCLVHDGLRQVDSNVFDPPAVQASNVVMMAGLCIKSTLTSSNVEPLDQAVLR